MLSSEERRQLSAIEAWISADDPAFAAGLAKGRPRAPRRDRRWPLQMVVALATGFALFSLVAGKPLGLVLGAVIACAAAVADQMRARRRHGSTSAVGRPNRRDGFQPF
ncbi:DUF3040 domain-containing protein [Cryptosporangium arvum]|uniref:DUF3040 domain-containing protein n=1 Tax=Cryptosporangium arvum DSM 44712 TaxID=927661 RepID=A0A010YYD0_9ACTN|nr:DUF3040 domain-containing protein [Cryptosporangium arvum]EXG80218.1 Protein of unknown function (DUF3040) [Cryptosporangium arvum DSM 44712]